LSQGNRGRAPLIGDGLMNTQITDLVRPDGRLLVRTEGEWTSETAAGAAAVARKVGAPALAHIGEEDAAERAALVAAGFAESRREAVIAISVEQALDALGDADLPVGVELRSAADVDENKLRLLDNELRQDVPGSSGWESTPDEFRDQSFNDPEFDSRTYLVAVDAASDEYIGIVRIWMKRTPPRLGFVGVRREYRRRGIGTALLAGALQAVHATGATEVTTEHDLTNEASTAIAERLGGRRTGVTVELVYEPEREVSRVG
jgi:RimJ/RimL family protein N-acetyltransferase